MSPPPPAPSPRRPRQPALTPPLLDDSTSVRPDPDRDIPRDPSTDDETQVTPRPACWSASTGSATSTTRTRTSFPVRCHPSPHHPPPTNLPTNPLNHLQSAQDGSTTSSTTLMRTSPLSPVILHQPTNPFPRQAPTSSPSGTPGSRTPSTPPRRRTPSWPPASSPGRPRSTSPTAPLPAAPTSPITRAYLLTVPQNYRLRCWGYEMLTVCVVVPSPRSRPGSRSLPRGKRATSGTSVYMAGE